MDRLLTKGIMMTHQRCFCCRSSATAALSIAYSCACRRGFTTCISRNRPDLPCGINSTNYCFGLTRRIKSLRSMLKLWRARRVDALVFSEIKDYTVN